MGKYKFVKIFVFSGVLLLAGCASDGFLIKDMYQARLEKQEARFEIEQLHARYLEMMDALQNQSELKPNPKEMADALFSDDAVIRVGDSLRFEGGNAGVEYAQWLESIHVDETEVKHFGMNLQIEITGATAKSRDQYLMVRSDKSNKEAGWLIGQYVNTLAKNEEGEWRFTSKASSMQDYSAWNAN